MCQDVNLGKNLKNIVVWTGMCNGWIHVQLKM